MLPANKAAEFSTVFEMHKVTTQTDFCKLHEYELKKALNACDMEDEQRDALLSIWDKAGMGTKDVRDGDDDSEDMD